MPAPITVSNLYQSALIQPAHSSDALKVVSGYASPAMVSRLITDLDSAGLADVELDIIVGMAGHEGVRSGDHAGYVRLQQLHAGRVHIMYTTNNQSVHSKLYIWSKGAVHTSAFAGSSNFTQNGFLIGARRALHSEALVEVDPGPAHAEFLRIQSTCVSASDPNVANLVNIMPQVAPHTRAPSTNAPSLAPPPSAPSIILPLVASQSFTPNTIRGGVHHQWGLNWGQRGNRDRNQAVIPYPAAAKNLDPDFFPRGTSHNRPQFAVLTDDNKALFMCVAEGGDKALHSIPSNAAMGQYFRDRLGIQRGAPATSADLRSFGSRFVRFTKVTDENYFMEYDPSIEAAGTAFYNF